MRCAILLVALTGCAGTLPSFSHEPEPVYYSNKSQAPRGRGGHDDGVALGAFFLTFGGITLATGGVLTGVSVADEHASDPITRDDGSKMLPLGIATAVGGALFTALGIAMVASPASHPSP